MQTTTSASSSTTRPDRKLARGDRAWYPLKVDAAFSELEEAFFREGDEMSAASESAVVIAEVIDISSRMIVDEDYYASIAVTIEADAASGGFEVAA